jgi:hypothetical protein
MYVCTFELGRQSADGYASTAKNNIMQFLLKICFYPTNKARTDSWKWPQAMTKSREVLLAMKIETN